MNTIMKHIISAKEKKSNFKMSWSDQCNKFCIIDLRIRMYVCIWQTDSKWQFYDSHWNDQSNDSIIHKMKSYYNYNIILLLSFSILSFLERKIEFYPTILHQQLNKREWNELIRLPHSECFRVKMENI